MHLCPRGDLVLSSTHPPPPRPSYRSSEGQLNRPLAGLPSTSVPEGRLERADLGYRPPSVVGGEGRAVAQARSGSSGLARRSSRNAFQSAVPIGSRLRRRPGSLVFDASV